MANLIKDYEVLAGFIIGFGIGLASALFAVMVIAL
jgi:hypothetical protein